MKSKINILIICILISTILSADYESLKAYKQQVKMQPHLLRSAAFKTKNAYYVIDFKDINKMNTFVLEQQYALKLSECIADGICIFKFLNAQTQQLNKNEILNAEPNIKALKEYKSYKFKAF